MYLSCWHPCWLGLALKSSNIFLNCSKCSAYLQLISSIPKFFYFTKNSYKCCCITFMTLFAIISFGSLVICSLMSISTLVDWLCSLSLTSGWWDFRLLTWNTRCTFIQLGVTILQEAFLILATIGIWLLYSLIRLMPLVCRDQIFFG